MVVCRLYLRGNEVEELPKCWQDKALDFTLLEVVPQEVSECGHSLGKQRMDRDSLVDNLQISLHNLKLQLKSDGTLKDRKPREGSSHQSCTYVNPKDI